MNKIRYPGEQHTHQHYEKKDSSEGTTEELLGVFCFIGRDVETQKQAFTARLISTSSMERQKRQFGAMGTRSYLTRSAER